MLFSDGAKTVLAFLLLGLVCNASHADADGLPHGNAEAGLVMDEKAQVLSGIRTTPAKAVQHHAEFMAQGRVVSIQPLLAYRERYLIALAELDGAKAKQKQSGQSLKRQQELFRHGVAAKRALQEQEALGSGNQAAVDASQAKLTAIANEARFAWGDTLAGWALTKRTDRLGAFISGRQQLLQVTLPSNKQLANASDTVDIEPSGKRAKAYAAKMVSRAAQADNAQQGESYFFRVSAPGLRVGMKVSAWLPESGLRQTGVVVPPSALVWYIGQVYVYIKVGEKTFDRRLVQHFTPTSEGYFVPDGIVEGEAVVTTGAQTLLSEALRGQIPDEDEP